MSSRRLLGLIVLIFAGLGLAQIDLAHQSAAADKPKKPAASSKDKDKADSAAKPETDEKDSDNADESKDETKKVVKTDAEWKKILTPLQFKIARKKGTEIAGTGKYAHTKKDGIYRCVCCGQPLFDSKTKFESGTGWPSFFQPLNEKAVNYIEDTSAGEVRTEVECSRCDAHLGHVFGDGPPPTGQRFCMNSAVLDLVSRDAPPKGSKSKDSKSKSAVDKSTKSKKDQDKEKDGAGGTPSKWPKS